MCSHIMITCTRMHASDATQVCVLWFNNHILILDFHVSGYCSAFFTFVLLHKYVLNR